MLKKFAYIMLNIMPMTTAIMPQFVYDFIILMTRLAYIAGLALALDKFIPISLGCSALIFDLLCS